MFYPGVITVGGGGGWVGDVASRGRDRVRASGAKAGHPGHNSGLPGCTCIPGLWYGCQDQAGEQAHQIWKNPWQLC